MCPQKKGTGSNRARWSGRTKTKCDIVAFISHLFDSTVFLCQACVRHPAPSLLLCSCHPWSLDLQSTSSPPLSLCVLAKRAGVAAFLPACLRTPRPQACLWCRVFTASHLRAAAPLLTLRCSPCHNSMLQFYLSTFASVAKKKKTVQSAGL